MNEPKVPRYSHDISQLCLRTKITAWSANEVRAPAMSFMPNQAAAVAATISGTHTKPAFCSHTSRVSPAPSQTCGAPPSAPNIPPVITIGTRNCAIGTPRLPSPAFKPSAVPLREVGKK